MENKNRGRKLPEEEFRKPIKVRFNESEKKLLKEKAEVYSGGNISKYIRSVALAGSIKIERSESGGIPRNDFYVMIREINKQGTNLNQLTKFFNSGIHKTGEIFFLLQEIQKTNFEINRNLMKILGFKENDR